MINLGSILKSRDITLPTKVCLVKAMVFPVVMYGCDSWTIKKAEHRKIDAFELWCWRRLLRVPWTARRSNQSILKEISPEYSLDMLKLKLQYFGRLMGRADSLEKTLMQVKIECRRRWGRQRMTWLNGSTNTMDINLSKLQELVMDREAWPCWSPWCHRVDTTEPLNWTWTEPWTIPLRRRDNSLQYPCLDNPIDREKPGGRPSMGLQRIRHDSSNWTACTMNINTLGTYVLKCWPYRNLILPIGTSYHKSVSVFLNYHFKW